MPLYRRRGRELELTEHGIRLLALGRELEERTDAFMDEVSPEGGTRPVVLAAGEGSFLYLLGDAIRRYQKASGAPLRVLSRNREGALEAVRSGEAHLGVTVLNEVPADLSARVVASVGTMVVMPKNHRLARRRSVSVGDLADEPLVLPPHGRPQRESLASAFSAQGATLSGAVEANGWEVILHFARLGLGLALVNDRCAVPAGMVGKSLKGFSPIVYRAVHRKDWKPSGAARKLLELVSK